ncbi:MAG: response regulator [Nitrospirae bacterium]|nr:response regulator [Nitrospirota bacterium]MBF0553301.1 response regulator [Nitrospirota bacterium]
MADNKKTILCVDDEEAIVEALYDNLMMDFEVKTALNVADALKIFDNEEIALVITDQRMPGMTGTELLAKINKAKPVCKKILLTGYADLEAAKKAINEGSVDRYFDKPWDGAELLDAAKNLVKSYEFDMFLRRMEKDSQKVTSNINTLKDTSTSFELFIDNYLSGICIVGQDNKIKFINKKACEILQIDSGEKMKGVSVSQILQINKSRMEEFFERFMNDNATPITMDIRRSNGAAVSIQASVIFNKTMQDGDDSRKAMCGVVFNLPSSV